MFVFLLAKKRSCGFLLDDEDEDEEEEEKEVLVLARVVFCDAKQTLDIIVLLFLLRIVEKVFVRILLREKKRERKKRTTTHKRNIEFFQHVVVVFVPDLLVQRPGAVLREIRVVFMDETKVVTQMETKT